MENKTDFLEEKIEIPQGVSIEVSNQNLLIKKEDKEVSRKIDLKMPVKIEKDKVTARYKKSDKKTKKKVKTIFAHIQSTLKGFEKSYEYKLQICYVHFPVTISVEQNAVVIKNFLGERKERKAKILEGVRVKVENEFITVESYDKEKAGQTAANIEKACKVKKRDRRIFQDGIYLTEKAKGRMEK